MQIRLSIKQRWEERIVKAKENSKPPSYLNTFNWKIRKSINIPPIEREIASAFTQLKLGHGYFKSYLYRFNRVDNERCKCNHTSKQTPEHLLLRCPKYRTERLLIKDHLNSREPQLKGLLDGQQGILDTLEFLIKTRISTRKWYLDNLSDETL